MHGQNKQGKLIHAECIKVIVDTKPNKHIMNCYSSKQDSSLDLPDENVSIVTCICCVI